jgi:hypothetical protein
MEKTKVASQFLTIDNKVNPQIVYDMHIATFKALYAFKLAGLSK